MRKFALLLVMVLLLAGCDDNVKTVRYQPGDFVESVIFGTRGQVVCNDCGSCKAPGGSVTSYKVRFAADSILSVMGGNTTTAPRDIKPGVIVSEVMCEFELRPAKN